MNALHFSFPVEMRDDIFEFVTEGGEREIVRDTLSTSFPHSVSKRGIDDKLHHGFGEIGSGALAQKPGFVVGDRF